MQSWKRIEPTTVTKLGYRTVVNKTFIDNNGDQQDFGTYYDEGREFAVVLAITDNKAIIARQFRTGPEAVWEELPGGWVDSGETPQQAAERELLEETGYEAGTIEYLGSHHRDAYFNAVWHCFLATDCTQISEQRLEGGEDIEVDLISISRLIENAQKDRMSDAMAVFLAIDRLKAWEKKV